MDPKQPLYFLEVVKDGEVPSWSVESPDLVSISRALDDGYVQFWAHPKDSVIQGGNEPPCEHLARQYQTEQPSLVVNQLSNGPALLELLVIYKGHVWVRTESSLENLGDSVAAILEYAQKKFKMKIEGFMTTDSVLPEVEKEMDKIEGDENLTEEKEESVLIDEVEEKEDQEVEGKEAGETESKDSDVPPAHSLDSLTNESAEEGDDSDVVEGGKEPAQPIRAFGNPTGYTPPIYTTGNRTDNPTSSKLWLLLPIIVLLAAIGGGYYFKDTILGKINGTPASSPTPLPTVAVVASPTPEPLPAVERGEYTLRVLNGTTTSGAASTLADKLKALGWKIERVGNAPDNDVAQTTIKVKAGKTDLMDTLVKDLAPDLLAASSSSNLTASDKADAEVVIGTE